MAQSTHDRTRSPFSLTRLARDTRGNAMAIMAAAIIPMAGMVGGGVDLSRMYLAKTRLQHACDAGALAGRKVMGGGIWSANNNAPNIAAVQFFDTNFENGAYGTGTRTRTFGEDAGVVTGVATVEVPMTLMRIFNMPTRTMTVNCDAEMRLPNTDVMFVLDNTGSMASTLSGDTQSKMAAMRAAVKCFYEILARLDTNQACTGGAPSGGVGSEVQVRFGFVPYDMNVNVGRLLSPTWFADRWTYQSRQIVSSYGAQSGFTDGALGNASNATFATYDKLTETECSAKVPANGEEFTAAMSNAKNWTDTYWQATQSWRKLEYSYTWTSAKNGCKVIVSRRTFTRTYDFNRVHDDTAGAVAFKSWRYMPVELSVAPLKNGNAWNNTIVLPTGNNYVNSTITWDGCIEERATIKAASYSPIPADAFDLNIDLVPSQGDPRTLWGPAIKEVVYPRKATYDNSPTTWSEDQITTFTNFTGKAQSCLRPARKLQEWPNAAAFDAYVDALNTGGNTYHDIGLLWGARLLSPTGLFRAENEFTPEGGEIQRHLIFMTDGETCTKAINYQAYGLSWYDRRQSDSGTVPSGDCETQTYSGGVLSEQVNARYVALCEAVKNKNITLWVIWFGANFPTAETRLNACATPSRFYAARNSAQLQETFRTIANQISQLRLTQ